MVRSELVQILCDKLPELMPRDVELAVNCMLEQMMAAIERDERIEIRGFGCFNLRHQAPRISRNPKTGDDVNLAAKAKIHFKPGKELRDRVNDSRSKCRITD